MKELMTKSWKIKSFFEVLRKATEGNTTQLDKFMSEYTLCSVNEDYSQFVIIRPFKVQNWKDERRILNTNPELVDEELQWGITICDVNASERSVAIPNYNYESIQVDKENCIVIKWIGGNIKTNSTEMTQKLERIYCENCSTEDIEEKFKSLCNEVITTLTPPEILYKTLDSKIVGEMKFDKKYSWYTGKIEIDNNSVEITLSLTYPFELTKNLKRMDKLLEKKFYEKAIQKMVKPIVTLKNESWLGEDEDGNKEPTLTKEELLKRIKITAIAFDDECCVEIYCDDDDIFWGHDIVIETNERGTFQDANLAG